MACDFKARGRPCLSDFLSCKLPQAGVGARQKERMEGREVSNSNLPDLLSLSEASHAQEGLYLSPSRPSTRTCLLPLKSQIWEHGFGGEPSPTVSQEMHWFHSEKDHSSEGFKGFPAIQSPCHAACSRSRSLRTPSP